MTHRIASFALAALISLAVLLPSQESRAGVFDIPHFVMPESWRIGLEPELTLTNGSGVGLNLKTTYGLSDLLNVQGTIGTGGGPKKFRIGGTVVADFFPDLESQPGIGLAGSAHYYRLETDGLFEVRFTPYIHKSFRSDGGKVFEPFIAVPFGFGINSDDTFGLSQLALGSMFQTSESFWWIVELGVAINNTQTSFSGGVVYYF